MIPLSNVIKKYDSNGNLIEVIDPTAQAAQAELSSTLLIIGIVAVIIVVLVILYAGYKMFTNHDPTKPTSF